MADEVETPRLLDELSKKNTATAPGPKRGGLLGRLWRLLVRLVLFGAVLAALGFLVYQQWQQNARLQQLSRENSQLQNLVSSSAMDIAELEQRLAQVPDSPAVTETTLNALQANFDGRLQQLTSDLADLRTQFSGSIAGQETRWRLLEAEYLHRLANRQLALTAELPVVIALLEDVDQLLEDSGDGRVAPARRALATELAELRAIQNYNPQALYSRLGQVRELVGQLEVTSESLQLAYLARLQNASGAGQSPAIASSVTANTGSGLDQTATPTLMEAALDFLESVFIWRDWQDSGEITEPPATLFLVAGNIDVMLQQAQLGVLTQRPGIFEDSLQRARALTVANREGLGEPAATVIEELDRLLADQSMPDLPELSQSLNLVEQLTPSPAPGSPEPAQ